MAAVLALDIPMTLVGLDATNDVPVPADIVDQLSADHGAAGADIAYEMYVRTPFLADGGSSYWDPLAAVTLTDPSVAGWEDMTVAMEPTGPGAGRLSRDPGGRPVRVAMSADREAFMTRFLAALRTGAPRSNPFAIAGSMEVRWDGDSCTVVAPPDTAGLVEVTLVNTTQRDVALLMGGAAPPKTWADVVTFVQHADLADPNLKAPDWIVQVPVDLSASAGTRSTAFAPIPAGQGRRPVRHRHVPRPHVLRRGLVHRRRLTLTRPRASRSPARARRARPPMSANSVTARLRWAIASSVRPAAWSWSARLFSTAASRCSSPVRRQATSAASRSWIAASRSPAAASTRASAFRAAMAAPGSGSLCGDSEAPRQRVARRVEVAALRRHQAQQSQRCADRPRIVVGRADLESPRGERAGERKVARTDRDHAPLHEDRPEQARVDHRPGPRVQLVERAIEMAGRGRRVAAPGVDPAEAQLDRREAGVGRHRRGGLERGDGAGVVAEHGAQLTDHRLEACDVRVPEGERRAEVIERLAVRVDRSRPGARIAEGLGRLGVATGGALVTGDQGEPARVVAPVRGRAQHLGDAPVQQAPPGQARRLVGGVAQACVAEVEHGPALAAPDLPDEAAPHELLEGSRSSRPRTGRWRPARSRGRTSGRSRRRPPAAGRQSRTRRQGAPGAARGRRAAGRRTPRPAPRRGPRRRTAGAPRTPRRAPAPRTPASPGPPRPPPGGRRRRARAGRARRASRPAPARRRPRTPRRDRRGPRVATSAGRGPGDPRGAGRGTGAPRATRRPPTAGPRRRPGPGRRRRRGPRAPSRWRPGASPARRAGRRGRRRVVRQGGRGRPPVAGRRAARSRAASAASGRPARPRASGSAKPARSSSTIGAYAIVALGGEGPGCEDASARGRDRLGERLREPRLADPRLARRAPRRGREASPRRWAATSAASSASRPTMGRRAGRTGRAATSVAAADGGRSTAACRRDRGPIVAAAAGSWASRIASYRSVVSASGATPSSRSRTATPARYWRMAPARSPARASRAISWRRAGSSSGIEVERGETLRPSRRTGPPRPRPSSPAARARPRPVARRRPRASPANRRSPGCRGARTRPGTDHAPATPPGAGPRGRPRRRRPRAPQRSTWNPSPSRATADRSAMTQRPPSAERRTDSVRRSALRADSSSDSGHSIAASSSRA